MLLGNLKLAKAVQQDLHKSIQVKHFVFHACLERIKRRLDKKLASIAKRANMRVILVRLDVYHLTLDTSRDHRKQAKSKLLRDGLQYARKKEMKKCAMVQDVVVVVPMKKIGCVLIVRQVFHLPRDRTSVSNAK